MKNLKGDNALNFLFLLHQKFKRLQSTICTEVRAQMMCEKRIECIDKFAPEKKLSIKMKRTRGLPTKLKTQWSVEIASSRTGMKIQTPKIRFS